VRWLLIDGFNLVFRSHFAMERSNLRRKHDQFPTGALHGWMKSLQDLRDNEKPDRAVVFFDLGGSERHLSVLPDYKAQRDETPEDIVLQLPEIKRLTALLGFQVVEKHGVEADDLIATAVHHLSAKGDECIIVSADKDFGQCVGGNVLQLTPPPTANPALGWRKLDATGVEEKFGVPPALIADYLALIGDQSDNIPGIKGVGPKTAVKWLKEYGGLEAVLAAADRIEPARFSESIKTEAERIRANLSLVRFQTHFGFAVDELPKENVSAVVDFLSSMEMHATLRRYKERHGLAMTDDVKPIERRSPPSATQGELF
jgi:DNA polymerase-1